MRELDMATDSQQTRVHCRVGGGHVDAERLGGTVQQQRVAEWFCGAARTSSCVWEGSGRRRRT
jgi:hypothetical protein